MSNKLGFLGAMIFTVLILGPNVFVEGADLPRCDFDLTDELSGLAFRETTAMFPCNVRKGSSVRATLNGTVRSRDPEKRVNAQYSYRIVAKDGHQTHIAGVTGNGLGGKDFLSPAELNDVNRGFVEVYVALSSCDIGGTNRKSQCWVENARLVIEQISE